MAVVVAEIGAAVVVMTTDPARDMATMNSRWADLARWLQVDRGRWAKWVRWDGALAAPVAVTSGALISAPALAAVAPVMAAAPMGAVRMAAVEAVEEMCVPPCSTCSVSRK